MNIKIDDILARYALNRDGAVSSPDQGRISSNWIVNTKQGKRVLIKAYDLNAGNKLGYNMDKFVAEPKVLDQLSNIEEVKIPKPLRLVDSNEMYLVDDNYFIFLYELLPGHTLTHDQLSLKYSHQAGYMLLRIIEHSVKCYHWQHLPKGGTEYIERILSTAVDKLPSLTSHPTVSKMIAYIGNFELEDKLEKTPKGIVHGDYFFENVVSLAGDLIGVIDFGDLFYGEVIHDVAIGSMEFSFLRDGTMEHDFYASFMKNFSGWLADNNISFDLFHAMLKVNCIRFFAHLVCLGLDNRTPSSQLISFEYNPYLQRYDYFNDPRTIAKLEEMFLEN